MVDSVVVVFACISKWLLAQVVESTIIKTYKCQSSSCDSNSFIIFKKFKYVVGTPIQEVVQNMRTSYLTPIHSNSVQTYSPPLFMSPPHGGWLYKPQAGTGGV